MPKGDVDADGKEKLAALVRERRTERGWTQDKLARNAGVSVDSVARIEGGTYGLPKRPRSDGHALDRLLVFLGYDVGQLLPRFFSAEELAPTIYAHHVTRKRRPRDSQKKRQRPESLGAYVGTLPSSKEALMEEAAMLNARAMAFLIALERIFDRFEFLVSNQPPFVLFADEEYVTTGSSSTELAPKDRETYHELIFQHREKMRRATRAGIKHYKVVVDKAPLIAFLAARSAERARRVVADMQDFLRFDSFDLVVVELAEPSDEFEVLAGHYPYSPLISGDAISIRHRRVGIGNTALYQLSLIGMNDELVHEDHRRAETLWRRGIDEAQSQPKSYSEFRREIYAVTKKRVVARLLQDALESAHPTRRR